MAFSLPTNAWGHLATTGGGWYKRRFVPRDLIHPDPDHAAARQHEGNDMLYQYNVSREYHPSARLETIIAPVLAINSADVW
jgi:hypothetical protein